MPRFLKFTLIGCGGLLGLFVLVIACAAIVGGGDSENDTGSSGKDEDKKGSKSKEKAGEETVPIGQPLTVGDVQWTVIDARQANQLVQPGISSKNAKTVQGNYVIVDFSFTNNGSDAITLDNESLALIDSQGRESKSSAETSIYVPQDQRILLERVNPGVSKQGEAIFEVAPDAAGFQVQAGDAKMFTDQNGYVDLGF